MRPRQDRGSAGRSRGRRTSRERALAGAWQAHDQDDLAIDGRRTRRDARRFAHAQRAARRKVPIQALPILIVERDARRRERSTRADSTRVAPTTGTMCSERSISHASAISNGDGVRRPRLIQKRVTYHAAAPLRSAEWAVGQERDAVRHAGRRDSVEDVLVSPQIQLDLHRGDVVILPCLLELLERDVSRSRSTRWRRRASSAASARTLVASDVRGSTA